MDKGERRPWWRRWLFEGSDLIGDAAVGAIGEAATGGCAHGCHCLPVLLLMVGAPIALLWNWY